MTDARTRRWGHSVLATAPGAHCLAQALHAFLIGPVLFHQAFHGFSLLHGHFAALARLKRSGQVLLAQLRELAGDRLAQVLRDYCRVIRDRFLHERQDEVYELVGGKDLEELFEESNLDGFRDLIHDES